MISATYEELCPICNQEITTDEIEMHRCKKKNKRLDDLDFVKEFNRFNSFFKSVLGFELRTLQRLWAKRILANKSFAAISPTGVGKSVFGLITALWFAKQQKKSYVLVPTTLLVKTFYEKINQFNEKAKLNAKIIAYHSELKTKEKKWIQEKIKNGEFDILITTINYLAKNYLSLKNMDFKFVFVDDIDAVLKNSRNVSKLIDLIRETSVLMVSSATAKPGKSAELFREKLGFSIGYHRNLVRNVIDTFVKEKNVKRLKEILKVIKDGGLIFTHTIEEAKELYETLKDEFKIGLATSENKEMFDDFAKGKLNFLIGISAPYGALIRGLDFPKRIKFTIFYGIPYHKFTLEDIENYDEVKILALARLLFDETRELAIKYNQIKNSKKINQNANEIISQIKKIVKEKLSKHEIDRKDVLLKDNSLYVPDLTTYIQGSGRSSRLYGSGLLLGLSIVLDNEEMLNILLERAMFYNIEFSELKDQNQLKEYVEKVEKDRKEKASTQFIIKQKLFVVESPTKAKIIANFFGKPAIRIENNAIVYEVTTGNEILIIVPTLGHLTDLIENKEFYGVKVVQKDDEREFIPLYGALKKCKKCRYQFVRSSETCPKCGSNEIYNAKNQIDVIRKLAYEAETVIIATDPDSEGEKIAWDVYNLVKPFAKEIYRAEFHEVTKKAIINALSNLRKINENLVKAQIVRRIEDRWIGFTLSGILQKRYKDYNLSAGRAQTPVLGWIVEATKQHQKYDYFLLTPFGKIEIKEELGKKINNKELKIKANILKKQEKETEIIIPPFTTDVMLKYASKILKFTPQKTMKIAQELFESGLITYHRTDSTRISDVGYNIAKQILGNDFKFRTYKSEGAHECIRPTKPLSSKEIVNAIKEQLLVLPINFSPDHYRLYDLIYRRFLAALSEGKKKELLINAKLRIYNEEIEQEFRIVKEASGKAYELWPYEITLQSKRLEEINLDNDVIVFDATLIKQKKPLLTYSEVIALMKSKGIGRPSTYATIVSKLAQREYIKGENVIYATKKGFKVFYFLDKHYHKFVSEERTKQLEEKLDLIEQNNADYKEILDQLFDEIKEIKIVKINYNERD